MRSLALGRVGLVFGVWVFVLFVAVFGVVFNVSLVGGSFTASSESNEPTFNMPFYGDALIAPDLSSSLPNVLSSPSSPSPGYYETSEYLIGKVAVGVILLESDASIDPPTESWTPARESQVVNEIQTALNWWSLQNPLTGVSFALTLNYRVPTSYEPVNRPHTDEGLWIREAMNYLGYSGAHYFTQVRDYVNDLRSNAGADWAFAMFIVDSYNDPDGSFTDMTPGGWFWFAYAYLGGPFLVMTYDNDNWGIDRMDRVTAHETGHIFYATDEYDGRTEYSGYLNVQDIDGSGALMDKNEWWLSSGTWSQVGWRDTDSDGLQDIVDTFPNTDLNAHSPDPTAIPVLAYDGTVTEIPYPNNNPRGTSRDVTINTITRVQFRIDSDAWINANAADGIFDEAVEEFRFTTPSLSLGNHTVEARGISSVGNTETSYSSDTVTVDYIPPTAYQDYDGLWKTKNFIINLTATDNFSGIARISYKINNGPIKTVSVYGQPLIATEGTSNTLEYWSVDNAGNEEEHHILTEIKLDKTTPTGTVLINNGDPYTASSFVTLTSTATDATSGVYRVRYSNDGVWETEPWETPSLTKAWTLVLGEGTKNVYYQVKDNAGLTSLTYQDTIIMDATKPTANAGYDQTVSEDTLVEFDGSVSTDANGIASYTWAYADTTPISLSGKNPTYTFATPGVYAVTLEVKDPAGNYATDTVMVTVLDITRPIANAGLNQTVRENTLVTFDATASSDNVEIASYTWAFSDVGIPQTLDGEKPTHTFETPGTYNVILNVTDTAGNWATNTITITVLDITKPLANAGQDQTVNVGAKVSFDGSSSTDNVDITRYEWNFGDETTGAGKTTTYTYASPGTYIVTLTVEDAAGNTATHQVTITVLSTEAFPMWMVGAAVVTIAIIAVATVLWRRRNKTPRN
ncbi:MAG TPA: PKD domain-containing protein [Candidatus Bathyarchaeia archaeon]|nr:PKD domain-containing protein [Candidatus Bathyarchaeia archaeon]